MKNKYPKQISINVWKEGNVFVSTCSELEISSSGVSIVESIHSIAEAIELWFENMNELQNQDINRLMSGMMGKGIIKEYQSLTREKQKSDKEIALDVMKKLPDDVDFEKIHYHLYASQKIYDALKRSDFEENGIPHKDVVKKFRLNEIAEKYRKGLISMAEASTLAEVSIYEMMEYCEKNKIYPPESDNLEKDIKDTQDVFKIIKEKE